jgi:hypothetical protein
MTYSTGYIPDPPEHLKTEFEHHARLLGSGGGRIASVSLSKVMPMGVGADGCCGERHFNQGGSSSCTGNALAAAVCMAFWNASAKIKAQLTFVPSQSGIYTIGRCLDRRRLSGGGFPVLKDNGAMPNQVVRGVNTYGVHPMVCLTDRYSDADPATINDEPQFEDLEADSRMLVIGSYGITSTGTKRISDMRTALAAGIPLPVAINAGADAFQGYEGGILTGAQLPGELDHYVVLSGYRTLPNGKTVFELWNSWADSWGVGGSAEIDESAAQTLGDIYAIVASRG